MHNTHHDTSFDAPRGLAWIFSSSVGPRALLRPEDGGGDGGAQSGDGNPGGGADAAGGGADGSGGNPAAPGQDPAGDGGGSQAAYRPQGLPDHLFGTSDQETIDKLAEAYTGARKAISQRGDLGEVPEKADGYGFAFSEDVQAVIGDVEKDALLLAVREDAHKHGLTDKQFSGFLDAAMKRMLDMGLVDPAVDIKAELAALAPDDPTLDDKGKTAAIERRIRDNAAQIDVWKSRGMPEESAVALQTLLDTAAGNKAVEYLVGRMGQAQPALDGKRASDVSEADVQARTRDPRNQFGSREYDAAFAAETTRLYQKLYGEEPRA